MKRYFWVGSNEATKGMHSDKTLYFCSIPSSMAWSPKVKVGYEVPLRGVLCLPSKLWHTKAFFKSPSLPTRLLLSSLLATGDQFYGLPFIAAAVLVALWWPCWIPPVTIKPSECPATNLVWSSVLVKSSSKQLPQQLQQHIACCYMSLVSEWWNTASNPSSSLGASLAY